MKVLQTIIAVKDGATFSSKEEGFTQLGTDLKAEDHDPSYYDDNVLATDLKNVTLNSSDTITIVREFEDVATYLGTVQDRDHHMEGNTGGLAGLATAIGWQFSEDIEPVDE